jgi:hypothetical protein
MTSEKLWRDFMKLAERFEAEPTLENYLLLRRTFPGGNVESLHFLSPDPHSSVEGELRQYGIEPFIFSDALDGNEHQIDELCLKLMERLVERQARERAGETHLQTTGQAIPDSLIDYLVITMLEATENHDLRLEPALVILIRERLGGSNLARHKQNLIDKNRKQAILLAASQLAQGKEISIRQIASKLDLEASTVSRWFKPGELEQEAIRVRGWFKEPSALKRNA